MSARELRSELDRINQEIPPLETDLKAKQKRLSYLKNRLQEITVLLNAPNTNIGVSDHALIRYLERRYGFNFEEYRAEILTPERVSMIKAGAKSINVDGVKMKIQNNSVVTVI